MKITERRLRQLIRETLLREARMTPETLPETVRVRIEHKGAFQDEFVVLIFDEKLGSIARLEAARVVPDDTFYSPEIGSDVWRRRLDGIETSSQTPDIPFGNCHGAWEVVWSSVPRVYRDAGWGPLLYDIAMEVAGPAGLIPDRASVSDEALAVWTFYLNRRSDVQAKPTDLTSVEANLRDLEQVTPNDLSDDCAQASTFSHLGKHPDWLQNPLRYVYRVTGTPTIDSLKSLGKIAGA